MNKQQSVVENLKELSSNVAHHEATLPLKHVTGGIFSGQDNEFAWEWDGAGIDYTAARHGLDIGRARELFNNENWEQLEHELNEHNAAQKRPASTLIIATWKNKAVGTMKNYNVVDHVELLEAVEDAGLSDNASGYMDKFGMRLDVRVSNEHTYIWLRIVNGHSGHKALRYYTMFKADDYEFEIPIHDRRRHLSKVEETKDNLKTMVEEVGEIRIENLLMAMSAAEAFDVITNTATEFNKRQTVIWDMVSTDKSLETALDVIIKIAAFTTRRGYKSGASKMIDAIMSKVS